MVLSTRAPQGLRGLARDSKRSRGRRVLRQKRIFFAAVSEIAVFRLLKGEEQISLDFRLEAGHFSASDDPSPLLAPAEVAKWLGVSSGWVRDHASRKAPRIPPVKLGSEVTWGTTIRSAV